MKIISQTVHIKKDGILHLDISTKLSETDAELVVVINPVGKKNNNSKKEEFTKAEIQMFEERWEEYKKTPSKAKTWKQVRSAITKKHGI